MKMLGKVAGAWLLSVAVGLSGCGRKGPVMVPVSGTVTLDGKPLPDGMIYFKRPLEGSVDQLAIQDGKFAGKVEVGDRRVEVSRYGLGTPIKIGKAELPNKIETLPACYNQESTLTATLTESGPNQFSFVLESKIVPVSGTVTLDEAALPEGTIHFVTIGAGLVHQMDIQDGKFAGTLPVGDRRVEISRIVLDPPIQVSNGEPPNKIETLPARYNRESTLKASVTESGPNEFTFAVESR
jgi:hypothetical protein